MIKWIKGFLLRSLVTYSAFATILLAAYDKVCKKLCGDRKPKYDHSGYYKERGWVK